MPLITIPENLLREVGGHAMGLVWGWATPQYGVTERLYGWRLPRQLMTSRFWSGVEVCLEGRGCCLVWIEGGGYVGSETSWHVDCAWMRMACGECSNEGGKEGPLHR